LNASETDQPISQTHHPLGQERVPPRYELSQARARDDEMGRAEQDPRPR
jgi:hypothetical protein